MPALFRVRDMLGPRCDWSEMWGILPEMTGFLFDKQQVQITEHLWRYFCTAQRIFPSDLLELLL